MDSRANSSRGARLPFRHRDYPHTGSSDSTSNRAVVSKVNSAPCIQSSDSLPKRVGQRNVTTEPGFDYFINQDMLKEMEHTSKKYGPDYIGISHSKYASLIKAFTKNGSEPLNTDQKNQLIPLLNTHYPTPYWNWRSITTVFYAYTVSGIFKFKESTNEKVKNTQKDLLMAFLKEISFRLNNSEIDVITMVTLLRSIGKLMDNVVSLEKTPELKDIVTKLLLNLQSRIKSTKEIKQFNSRNTTELLWAIGKLVDKGFSINTEPKLKQDKTLNLEEIVVLLFQNLASSDPLLKQESVIGTHDVVTNLWAMAKLTHKGMKLTNRPEIMKVLDSLLRDLRENYNGYDLWSLPTLLDSMARLLEAGPKNAAHIKDATNLLPYVSIVLEQDADNKLNSQNISYMLWGIAKIADNIPTIETPYFTAVPVTDTTLATTAMPQATHLGSKHHHTPKVSSKVCELEKDRVSTGLAGQGVKSKAEIAAHFNEAANLLLPHVITQASNFNRQCQTNSMWALAKLVEKGCNLKNEPNLKDAVYGILRQAKRNIKSIIKEEKLSCENIGDIVWSIAKFMDYDMNFNAEPEFDDIVYALFYYVRDEIEPDLKKEFIKKNISSMLWAVRILSEKMLDPNIPNPDNILKFKKFVLELLSHINIHDSYTNQGINNMLWSISRLGSTFNLTEAKSFRKIILELLAQTKIKAVSSKKNDRFSEHEIACMLNTITHLGSHCLLQNGSRVIKETVVALLSNLKSIEKKESLDYSLQSMQYVIGRVLYSLAAMGDFIEINKVKAVFADMINKISVNDENYNEQNVFSCMWALMAYNARLDLNDSATDNSIIQRKLKELFDYAKKKTIDNNNNKTILPMVATWLGESSPVTIEYQTITSKWQDRLRDKLCSELSVAIEEEKMLGNLAPVDLFLPYINTAIEVSGPNHYFCHDFFTKNGATLLKKSLLEKLGHDVMEITVRQVDSDVSVQKCIDQIREKIEKKRADDHFALPKVSAKENTLNASDDDYYTASDDEYHTANEDNDNSDHTTKENEKYSASKENKKSFTTDEHLSEDENKNVWQTPKKRNKKKFKTKMFSH